MDIRAAAISAILKEQIKNFGPEAQVTEAHKLLGQVSDEDYGQMKTPTSGEEVMVKTDISPTGLP